MADNTPPGDVVRLSANVPAGAAATLKRLAEARGATATEEIRRAIAIDKIVSEAIRDGHRVTVIEGHGDSATYRDLVIL